MFWPDSVSCKAITAQMCMDYSYGGDATNTGTTDEESLRIVREEDLFLREGQRRSQSRKHVWMYKLVPRQFMMEL